MIARKGRQPGVQGVWSIRNVFGARKLTVRPRFCSWQGRFLDVLAPSARKFFNKFGNSADYPSRSCGPALSIVMGAAPIPITAVLVKRPLLRAVGPVLCVCSIHHQSGVGAGVFPVPWRSGNDPAGPGFGSRPLYLNRQAFEPTGASAEVLAAGRECRAGGAEGNAFGQHDRLPGFTMWAPDVHAAPWPVAQSCHSTGLAAKGQGRRRSGCFLCPGSTTGGKW